MKSCLIKLDTMEKVKLFVNIVSKYEGDFDLVSGRYVINGKSIMGIFSLDLSEPVQLHIYCDSEQVTEELAPFIVS